MSNYAQALKVVKRLRQQGFEALFAGGCVRDQLLGREASDYDVVTDATPDRIIALFRRTLKIGAQFGVVMVILEGRQVEVATFRTEGGYQDGRRPGFVEFASAREDASRRDFTINGMFYDPIEGKVLDFVGGREDLERRIIRTIGEPSHRFSEDYLRMLRAIRFAARLDFHIEEATWGAICEFAPKISVISAERIAVELEMILTDPGRGRGGRLLIESGLAGAIFPGVAGEDLEAGSRTLEFLPDQVDFGLALAAFLSRVETDRAVGMVEGLKLSNVKLKKVRNLLENRGVLMDADMPIADLRLMLAEPYYGDLLSLQFAICRDKGESTEPLETLKRRAEAVPDRRKLPPPLLDGHELLALGVPPGPPVGKIMREMFAAQLSGQIRTPEEAREWVEIRLKEYKCL